VKRQDLGKRIQQLEDIEEIKRLKARYCAFCGDHYDADGLAALSSEDAVRDGGSLGRYDEVEEIRKFFCGISAKLPFALRYVMNSLIEVDGDPAMDPWYLLEPCTFAKGAQALGCGLNPDRGWEA